MKHPEYKPERCDHCGMTTTYLLPVDRGASIITIAIAAAIRRKGINAVHVVKEMLIPAKEWNLEMARQGYLDINKVRNVGRTRLHGLIAKVKGHAGNYCLTPKGAAYLKGQSVPKYAIRSKSQKKTIGYLEEEKYQTNIRAELAKETTWEGIDFDIVEGRVLIDPPNQKVTSSTQTQAML